MRKDFIDLSDPRSDSPCSRDPHPCQTRSPAPRSLSQFGCCPPRPKVQAFQDLDPTRGQAISPIGDSLLAPNAAGFLLASGGRRFSGDSRTPITGGKSLFADLWNLREA